MIPAYIALGSNLASPRDQVEQAIESLSNLLNSSLVCRSRLYETKPVGPQDQPNFINAAALIETDLKPIALLDELQRIELEQGRVRGKEQFGPRTLDLDLLLYADETIKNERLVVPHYAMREREFVLRPLYEIAPDLILPTGERVAELLQA